jgi:hypothetical protein
MRIAPDALGRLQQLQWTAPQAASQANEIFRQMLLAITTSYLGSGNAAEIRPLIARAATLTAVSPDLTAFIERYPSAALPGADQVFYWSAMPAGAVSIVSLHHLVVFKQDAGQIWIADKNLYASRYFDAGVIVIGLYDVPDGSGFYAVAGSRVKSGQLGGTAAMVLRRQIQRTAADNVKMYLEWMRDSLAAG